MTQHVRIGPAPAGTVPFVKAADGTVTFDGQGGRKVDFGHSFDSDRGYRVFFCFADTPHLKNTWGGDSLLTWANGLTPRDDAGRTLKAHCRRLANQVIALNAEWQRQGKPRTGIREREAGHA